MKESADRFETNKQNPRIYDLLVPYGHHVYKLGLQQSRNDLCWWYKREGEDLTAVIVLQVDDSLTKRNLFLTEKKMNLSLSHLREDKLYSESQFLTMASICFLSVMNQ